MKYQSACIIKNRTYNISSIQLLFNNDTQIFRVAVNSDETKDTEFIRQLADQGGVKVAS